MKTFPVITVDWNESYGEVDFGWRPGLHEELVGRNRTEFVAMLRSLADTLDAGEYPFSNIRSPEKCANRNMCITCRPYNCVCYKEAADDQQAR